jgi:hypothetical protein
MADDRAAQPALERAHRHQVHRGQGHAGDQVEVGPVARVEAERVHHVREQLRVQPVRAPAAVLVGLDLHERDLRPPGQAGDRERVRVGLLELVGGPVHDELAELVERRTRLEEARQRRPLDRLE